MGKPTGFLEIDRALPLLRPPEERLGDWGEFHVHQSTHNLQLQGARCMDCGVPFCQSGVLIGNVASGCPLHNQIPEWNDLVYRGNWHEALTLLHETNNFPEFTGRVCPAPCESSCVLGINDLPVSIKSIECAIVDHGFEHGWISPQPPSFRTEKRVAVIGSGPAGLACADQLNKAGHKVTVWERGDRIGGLLMYGIPNMKLEKWRVQRRVDLLEAEGISFVTNVEVGKDCAAEDILSEFDAVVICTGSTRPRDLAIPNRNLRGIHFAMDFLKQNTRSYLDSRHVDKQFIDARDKDVVVIGGGDTGTDCVATALRHECRSLVQFELLPQSPDARSATNPWPQWPLVHRIDYGHEEYFHRQCGDPRKFSVKSKQFVRDNEGRVGGVETETLDWREGTQSTRSPAIVSGSAKIWPAQLVLLALGFVGPEEGLLTQLGVRVNERGNVEVDENKMTSVDKVFAAGDAERGQSLVVWAIADGRRAAASVDSYLAADYLSK